MAGDGIGDVARGWVFSLHFPRKTKDLLAGAYQTLNLKKLGFAEESYEIAVVRWCAPPSMAACDQNLVGMGC